MPNNMELKKWLDTHAGLYKIFKAQMRLDSDISVCDVFASCGIHISNASAVANALNLPTYHEPWSCNNSRAMKVSFEYSGVTFFALENFSEEVH